MAYQRRSAQAISPPRRCHMAAATQQTTIAGARNHGGGMATVRGKQATGVGGMGIKRRKQRRRATWRQHSADVNGNIGRGKAAREQARHAAAAPASALVRAHRVGDAASRRRGASAANAWHRAWRRGASPHSYRTACFSCLPPSTSALLCVAANLAALAASPRAAADKSKQQRHRKRQLETAWRK
jgi:hypothetical protein